MVKHLGQRGCRVTTLDKLSGGFRDAVLHGEFFEGDIADRALLDRVFASGNFDAVMHFASFIQVGESVQNPATYNANNLVNTLPLLDAMRAAGVDKFIFSSTAAIFGEPQSLKSVCLRCFNAAGADPEGQPGERHEPETHLIPLVLQAALRRRSHISVFGQHDDTPDGTCIRDCVHINDLCEAHWLAVQGPIAGGQRRAFNLGNGFSVQQVIDTARQVTGLDIAVQCAPRRTGDPARLVADASLAQSVLCWQPRHAALETLIGHAWP